ncbi:hypothetical protein [Peribacillus frigoritolerans]|uniref:hypothetical protein n=1 Tax=Peribacillus frigoritolerans TaxID=450367 RepID=UPI0024C14BB4|nr:hypothetical protein [Peribacillus frigoritolerans]WHX62773.1 hypothetical protein QNH33_04065 [Peribacillus frigoritolerans]
MKELTLNLNATTTKLLQEITVYHNRELGIVISPEETLKEIIIAHYYCEVLLRKTEVEDKSNKVS